MESLKVPPASKGALFACFQQLDSKKKVSAFYITNPFSELLVATVQ